MDAAYLEFLTKEEKEKERSGLRDLRVLQFQRATTVDVGQGRIALLVYVPPTQLAKYRALQKPLTEALEKKFVSEYSNVLILANRTMVSSEHWARSKKHSGLRPRNRSLKVVQEAILDDLVYPSEISGKRIKVKVGGEKVLTIQLGGKESMIEKKEVIEAVYKHLTTKAVNLDL